MNVKRVEKNWTDGLYNKEQMKQLYYRHVITLDEYKLITSLPQKGDDMNSPDE